MRPGAEPRVRWTLVGGCIGAALTVMFGGAPVWVLPIAVTVGALIALPEIVDRAQDRRRLTLGMSVACILATWFLRPTAPVAQPRQITAWQVALVTIIVLLFIRLSIVYLRRGAREIVPIFDPEFDRLLPLLEAEIGRHLIGRGIPQRHYLDSVLSLIRDHRKEGTYPALMNALQDLAVAYGRVAGDTTPMSRGRVGSIFGASSYYTEVHAARAAVKAAIADREAAP